MDGRLRALAIRSIFLFLLSLVLVAGFWFHREFYQIGFTNLLIIGGVRPFRVLRGAAPPRAPPARRRPERRAAPGVARVVRAKYEPAPGFARLLIEDPRRTFRPD